MNRVRLGRFWVARRQATARPERFASRLRVPHGVEGWRLNTAGEKRPRCGRSNGVSRLPTPSLKGVTGSRRRDECAAPDGLDAPLASYRHYPRARRRPPPPPRRQFASQSATRSASVGGHSQGTVYCGEKFKLRRRRRRASPAPPPRRRPPRSSGRRRSRSPPSRAWQRADSPSLRSRAAGT